MCIICVSKKGIRQPNTKELKNMFDSNPDGAGFMYLKKDGVHISKGYMYFQELQNQLLKMNFTNDDVVIYHFRKSTQAGVHPEFTHPYPYTTKMDNCKALDLICSLGIAHNGIISFTSDGSKNYNDTMLFITNYFVKIVKNRSDLLDEKIQDIILQLTKSKFAFLDKYGDVVTIGDFNKNDDGLLFSNYSYLDKININDFYNQKYISKNCALKGFKY